jgi:hypothetical protein
MLVLATLGPFMMVMVIVMTDKVIVQRLTDYIYTGRELDSDDSHYVQIAKVLYVICHCIGRLSSYYATVQPSTTEPNSEHPQFFPSITSYRDEATSLTHSFRYIHSLDQHASCMTFLANAGGTYIVVKFVKQYGIAAHRHLAKGNFAPQVMYCGPVDESPGAPSYCGYQMVVMEWIDGTLAAHVVTGELPGDFVAQVREAMTSLHSIDHVFGDLRRQNIMINRNGKVKMVDFDWSGLHDTARYPVNINMNTEVTWPEGVGP